MEIQIRCPDVQAVALKELVRPKSGVSKPCRTPLSASGAQKAGVGAPQVIGWLERSHSVRLCGVICLWFGSFWFQAGFHNRKSSFPLAFPSPPSKTPQTRSGASPGAARC